MTTDLRPILMLLVEDSDDDVELTLESLRADKIVNEFRRVHHGGEALDYLHQVPPFEGAPRPDLIMLDLHMPVMDGAEFLRQMKKEDEFAQIPVVVFTSSEEEKDRLEMENLGASSYAVKPMDLKQFQTLVKTITDYLVAIVRYAEAA